MQLSSDLSSNILLPEIKRPQMIGMGSFVCLYSD